MTKDETIAMAREAGFNRVVKVCQHTGIRTIEAYAPDSLQRFADSVAAAAVAAEREACARVCDDAAHRLDCKADELRKDAMETGDYTIVNGVEFASDALASAAEAIRAQGLA